MTYVSLWITLWKLGISFLLTEFHQKLFNDFQIKYASKMIQIEKSTSSVNETGSKIDQMN